MSNGHCAFVIHVQLIFLLVYVCKHCMNCVLIHLCIIFLQVDTGPLNTAPGCDPLWLLEETTFQEWESNQHPCKFKSEWSGLYHQEMAAHKP